MIRFVALLVLLMAPAAAAQNGAEIAVMGCRNAVVKKLRAMQSDADSVRLSPGASVTPKDTRAALVSGTGQYFDKATREWRAFTYDCTYMSRSGNAQASVQLHGDTRGQGR
jgi:hypothetical protein